MAVPVASTISCMLFYSVPPSIIAFAGTALTLSGFKLVDRLSNGSVVLPQVDVCGVQAQMQFWSVLCPRSTCLVDDVVVLFFCLRVFPDHRRRGRCSFPPPVTSKPCV